MFCATSVSGSAVAAWWTRYCLIRNLGSFARNLHHSCTWLWLSHDLSVATQASFAQSFASVIVWLKLNTLIIRFTNCKIHVKFVFRAKSTRIAQPLLAAGADVNVPDREVGFGTLAGVGQCNDMYSRQRNMVLSTFPVHFIHIVIALTQCSMFASVTTAG